MSLTKRTPRRPAFGIVGAPVETVAVPGAGRQIIDAAAHGMVPRDAIRTDHSRADPQLDAWADAARRGEWRWIAASVPPVGADPDVRYRTLRALGRLAETDDAWLDGWLDGTPDDPTVWCVHASAMTDVAWKLRTGASAGKVLPEQWAGFRRVLGQAPAACERAAALAPDDPTPWIMMMAPAQGLSWSNDRFREIWATIVARAPRSVGAHLRALQYWLPRWQGSDELATAFVDETMSYATPGSLLTGVRLEWLFMERLPGNAAAQDAFYRSAEVTAAIDAAVADLRAAAPTHPYHANQRHWLAWYLTKAGRFGEAVEEFRALGGYCGAWPWQLYGDAVGQFTTVRAEALHGLGGAGAATG
jgi:hypothetical protein